MGKKGETMENENPNEESKGFLKKATSRRDFLKMAGVGSAGAVAIGLLGCSTQQQIETSPTATSQRTTYVPPAKMMILHDSSRCVGCRRCEVACTLAHDNKIQPAISRVKISRNFNFGPEGPKVGWQRGQGLFGNYRLIADTCLQCAHPTPCMLACPSSAIELDSKTNARVINTDKCTGCQTCVKACPWAMTSYDVETKKSTKCDLCGGDPECVKICPAGALTYVPWKDRSGETPMRQVVPAFIGLASDAASTCIQCHPTATTTAAGQ